VAFENIDGAYGVGVDIKILVTFNEVVTVTGTPTMSLALTGSNVVTADYSSGSGGRTLSFSYTVQENDVGTSINFSGTDSLVLSSGTTITDAASNAATLTLPDPVSSSTASQSVDIDGTRPTILSQKAAVGGTTIAVGFSEEVSGSPEAVNFGVTVGGTASTVSSVSMAENGLSGTITIADTITDGATVLLTYTPSSTANLRIKDTSGGEMAAVTSALTVDTTGPTVSGVLTTAQNATYAIGDTIPITVTFSDPVNVTGVPTLTLETGSSDAELNYVSGSGTASLLFNYTVTNTHASLDLDVASASALAVTTGVTIKDLVGNNATLTLPSASDSASLLTNHDIVVDGVRPSVSVSTDDAATSGAVATAGTKVVTLTTSEALGALSSETLNALADDFTVTNATSGENVVTAVAANGSTITLTLTDTILNDASLTVAYARDAANLITDASGNDMVSVTPARDIKVVNDSSPPTISKVYTPSSFDATAVQAIGDIIPIHVVFNEGLNVSGVPTLKLETGTADAVVNYASTTTTFTDNDTLVFDYTVESGHTATDLATHETSPLGSAGTIVDNLNSPLADARTLPTVGSGNALKDPATIVVDGVRPTVDVTTNDAATSGAVAYAGTKTVTLTTSETLAAPSSETLTALEGDFTVTNAGGAENVVTAVAVSGTSITLTVTDTIQNGASLTVAYALDTSNPIEDANGNDMAAISNAREITVVDDNSAPTVLKVHAPAVLGSFDPAAIQAIGDIIPIHVVFSEAVNVTDVPTLKLETGATDADVDYTELATTNVANDTLVFEFTVGDGNAIHLSSDLATHETSPLGSAGTIVDNLGTAANRTLPAVADNTLVGAADIVIDGSRPTVNVTTDDSDTSGAVVNAGTKTITLTTSETLTTPSSDTLTALAGDFTVTNAGGAENVVTAVAVSGTSITLTVTDTILNSASWTVAYALDTSNPIEDANGNDMATISNAREITVVNDTVAPTVLKVHAPAVLGSFDPAAIQAIGDIIPIHVVFSEAVNVTDVPTLKLETGATDADVDYTELATTNVANDTLVFEFTVGDGNAIHLSSDLATNATSPLPDSIGGIFDNAGTAANRTLPSVADNTLVGAADIVIDGSRPTVNVTTDDSDTSGAVVNAGTKTITLTTSETLTTPSSDTLTALAGDFTVTNAGGAENVVTAVAVSGTSITLTVTDTILNSASWTVAYALDTSNPIEDANGNDMATISNAREITVVNDTVAPTVLKVHAPAVLGSFDPAAIQAIGDIIPIHVVFSEAVNVTDVPTLKLETGATDADVDYTELATTNVANDTLVFEFTVGDGNAIHLSSDLATNATSPLPDSIGGIFDNAGTAANRTLPSVADNTLVGAADIVIDGSRPTVNVTTDDSDTSGAVVNAGTKTITLTTSETLTTPSSDTLTALAGDFTVTNAGGAENVVTAVAVSGTSITLTVTDTILNSASWTVAYALDTSNPIEDANGNDMATISNAREITVVNDTVAPTVLKVHAPAVLGSFDPAAIQAIGDIIPIHVVFSEAVNVTDVPTLKLETGATDADVDYTELATTNVANDTLVFEFTVGDGNAIHLSSDLATNATSPLPDSIGGIFDNAGTAANRTLPSVADNTLVGAADIVIDGSRPDVECYDK
jgi:uncharacterized repeat protein (TIGR02059 family)